MPFVKTQYLVSQTTHTTILCTKQVIDKIDRKNIETIKTTYALDIIDFIKKAKSFIVNAKKHTVVYCGYNEPAR